ncbi:unnamed protein product [Phytophthora fragariaefolia]|uniref:Unnamed protein product n=1 Tax=Phytophthora fragariaefolia TaxID=1490495 RepID=A0A9W6XQU6_9STRA|nr:unnamed protein product [Phytophthora fragariaefolia]
MSVKDINPDDGRGVIDEFKRKIQKLLRANADKNFVTEMYSDHMVTTNHCFMLANVNCSPPFRSHGYHESLLHARQRVEELMKAKGRPSEKELHTEKMSESLKSSQHGFRNGHSFHNTIRLVLAKISLLDWIGVKDASQEMQLNDIVRKLPGVIRTGCIIPVDYQCRDENAPQYLKHLVLYRERDSGLLHLDELGRNHTDLVDCWTKLNQQLSLDKICDDSIDFGPGVCVEHKLDGEVIHLTLVALFQRYLEMTQKDEFERICASDYTSFDAMLSFLAAGHDGDHRCNVKHHACGVGCNATHCTEKCVLGIEHVHTVHKCTESSCIYVCEMQDCGKRCAAENHFHDRPDLASLFALENGLSVNCVRGVSGSVRHMCSSPHACSALCESGGICSRVVRVATRRFNGKYTKFDFDLKRMVGVRNKCAIILEPGQTKHDQDYHSCERLLTNGRTTLHWCDTKCVACDYYCEKPVGHDEMHSAAHGNMTNTHFITSTNEEVVEWDNQKYAAGEQGIAECVVYCTYSGEADKRRHCQKTRVKPTPEHEVDEILHAKYWETIGWEDPCPSATERALFDTCPYMCIASEHRGRGKARSGCDLPAWHTPATSVPFVEKDGFTYIEGHRFTCSHASAAGILHHIFVLDCSGSMRGDPWNQLLKGVREYLRSRIASGAVQDVVSAVTFGDKGVIEFERAKIENVVTRNIKFHGGGTNYAHGLRQAKAIISRTHLDKYKPILIFFTDGRPGDGKKGLELAKNIRHDYTVTGLRSFVVGYGRVSELGVAELAHTLGGTVYEAMTVADVGEAFRTISLSLGARAGLICSSGA